MKGGPAEKVLKPMVWYRIPNAHIASACAPPISCVYAYAQSEVVGGLPFELKWVYVGQARNLKKRLENHEKFAEPNSELIRWVRKAAHAEVWYAAVPPSRLILAERELIQELKPKFNRIRYERKGKHERRD